MKPQIKKRKKKITKSKRRKRLSKRRKRLPKRRKRLSKRRKRFKKAKTKNSSKNIILRIIRLQDALTPRFNFTFNLDKAIQRFFKKIADKIDEYKAIKAKENERKRLEKVKKMQQENILEIRDVIKSYEDIGKIT